MRALILRAYNNLEIIEAPRPNVGPDDVLVRVKACGICGSDVHGMDGSTGRRIPPVVMGHEAAGIVSATGERVTRFRVGDRVTFDSTIYCGECYFCRKGQVNLCENREVLGVSVPEYRRNGAFAEFVTVPERIAYSLPDALSFEEAAMIEAVSVAVHAVGLTPVKLGDAGVVVGAGMIGLLAVQALRNAGCGMVVAVDVDAARLELARSLGADYVFDSRITDVSAALFKLTGGRGADVAVECVGAAEAVQTAVTSLRKGGTATLVGNIAPQVPLPLQTVVTRQLRLQGSCASAGEYPACIDLLARKAIRVDPLISATAPLDDGPLWFDRLYRREPGLMKIILQP
jgi:L-iditol 2-dehydrogenase